MDDEDEIFVQRLSGTGAEVGANDRRISTMGPNGDTAFTTGAPSIAYNSAADEYLATWSGEDNAGILVDNELEIFAQRLRTSGAPTGNDDQRISDMGPNGDIGFRAADPRVVANPASSEYLVVWRGNDAGDDDEIFIQRLSAGGVELGANDRRISDMGPPGDTNFNALLSAVVRNSRSGEYLVVWYADDDTPPLVNDESEIFAQGLSSTGTEIRPDDQRISDMGPDGSSSFDGLLPAVAYDDQADEYLVAWSGDDDRAPLVGDEFEIFAQRLTSGFAEVGDNDERVSFMGNDGQTTSEASAPAVAYDPASKEYLVVWTGDTPIAPLVDNKFEIHARRLAGGTALAGAGAVCKTLPPVTPATPGDPSDITLTVGQLLINQRIDQAAIRRANGVQAWLDDGIEGRDVCGGAVGPVELATGITFDTSGPALTFVAPAPRPVVIPPATPGDPSDITLSTGQLLINQRISQAAIRRLNALKARMDGGLTGGDVEDRAIGPPQLSTGLRIINAPAPPTPPARSTTDIAPAAPGDPSQVTLSTTQLLINQRISQAAVRRANDLIGRIDDGLVGTDMRDGGLTGLNLAPEAFVP